MNQAPTTIMNSINQIHVIPLYFHKVGLINQTPTNNKSAGLMNQAPTIHSLWLDYIYNIQSMPLQKRPYRVHKGNQGCIFQQTEDIGAGRLGLAKLPHIGSPEDRRFHLLCSG